MEPRDYYSDQKFCTTCQKYVGYLMSLEFSYCTECGQRVRLFSKEDWVDFNEGLQRNKPKGGRPRKQANTKDQQPGKESA